MSCGTGAAVAMSHVRQRKHDAVFYAFLITLLTGYTFVYSLFVCLVSIPGFGEAIVGNIDDSAYNWGVYKTEAKAAIKAVWDCSASDNFVNDAQDLLFKMADKFDRYDSSYAERLRLVTQQATGLGTHDAIPWFAIAVTLIEAYAMED